MGYIKFNIILVALLVFIGCAGSRINISKSAYDVSVSTIALMPSGGIMADAIGIELMNYGFNIFDTAITTSYMVRLNLSELEFAHPQNLRKLADDGIDAILIVKAVAGYDNRPNSATVRLVATKTGQIIIGGTWQNGKGGAKGSPADGMMRKDIGDAAKELAKGIGKSLGHR